MAIFVMSVRALAPAEDAESFQPLQDRRRQLSRHAFPKLDSGIQGFDAATFSPRSPSGCAVRSPSIR